MLGRRFLRPRAAAAVVAATIAAGAAPVPPQVDTRLLEDDLHADMRTADHGFDVQYRAFFGGFEIATARLKGTLSGAAYEAWALAETDGILRMVASGRLLAGSAGLLDGTAEIEPSLYNADLVDRKKRQQVVLDYTAGPAPKLEAAPPYNSKKRPVPEDLKVNTVDPVSALLSIALKSGASEARPCGDPVHVFDGKRRYDVEFKFVANETIKTGPEKAYVGPAVRCSMHHTEIAGFKKIGPNNPNEVWLPWHVWLAPLDGGRFMVPVRIEAPTPYGTGVARAVKISLADTDKAAAADK